MSNDVAPPLAAGRLRLRRVLGAGGVGTVYEAYDERLDVARAVKVLARERADNAVQRQRFLTEARIQARLRHPNVVEVYDIEDDGQDVYMVMELVPGGSLWDWLRREGPLAPRWAVEMILGILDALQQAHAMDVVHRDIKPHNILLSAEGRPKLADFGVAQLQTPQQQDITRTGMVMGTWAFMAPEQRVSSRRVDRRSDLYGVGATLYTLLTDATEPDLFDHDLDSEAYAILPEALRPVIRRATRYARAERYPTAEALREDLQRVLPLLPEPTPVSREIHPEDAPEAPAHLAREPGGERQAPPPREEDPPRAGPRSVGTLVPSLSEVDRLLATPPAGAERPTFSDEGHTVDVPRPGSRREPAGEPVPVPLPITEEREPPPPRHVTWSMEDELSLTEGAPPDRVTRPWRRAARLRWLAFLILVGTGIGLWQAARYGLIAPPASSLGPAPEPAAPTPITPRAPVPAPAPESAPPALARPAVDSPPVARPEPAAGRPVLPESAPVVPVPATSPAPEVVRPAPSPAPTPPAPDPYAGLSLEDLRRVVRVRNEAQIYACYEQALLTNPHLKGSLTLRWRVEQGAVVAAAAIQTPGNHVDLRECAVAALSTWRYPADLDDQPPSHDWVLDPASRTAVLAQDRLGSLQHCAQGLSDDQRPRPGRGQIQFVVVDGVVQDAHMSKPFDSEAYDECLLADVRSWVFPPWGVGLQTVDLSVSEE
ncbi:MAG: protein kinase [Pseudomonadota bacterium]